MTDLLSNKIERTLKITTTKTTGDDEIKKAREKGEDVAVLSTALPFEASSKSEPFDCGLGYRCMLGDPRRIYAGKLNPKSGRTLFRATPPMDRTWLDYRE